MCYVLEVDGKEKLVPVSDSLTHILSSLFGEGVNIDNKFYSRPLKSRPPNEDLVYSSKSQVFSPSLETAGSFSSSSLKAVVAAVPASYTTSQRNALR